MAEQGRPLPGYVRKEFDEYLKCGRLEYGFLRLCCDTCHAEQLLAFSCKRRGQFNNIGSELRCAPYGPKRSVIGG